MQTRKRSEHRLLSTLVWSALIVTGLGLAAACGSSNDNPAGSTSGAGAGNSGAGNGGTGSGTAGNGSGTAGNGTAGTGYTIIGDSGQVQIVSGGMSVTDSMGTFTCYQITCESHLLECGDCQDGDDDGLIDSRDPECLGPCDNTEGEALTAGVGGENGGPCKADCYFDFGNGSGGDDCIWDHACDPLSVAPDYHPEGMECAYDESMLGSRNCPADQSQTCLDTCRPLTPNGCDCFGCCTFPELAGKFVWIGSVDPNGSNEGSCTFDTVTDETKCEPCTPVENCFNDCGVCELCLGKNTLPPECLPPEPDAGVPYDAGPPPGERCSNGDQPCGLAGDEPCPQTYYCITGCCQANIR